jgi:hypothetical protein
MTLPTRDEKTALARIATDGVCQRDVTAMRALVPINSETIAFAWPRHEASVACDIVLKSRGAK